jgi:molybdopterin-guanine dinucleotide biosynthesis protein A
VVEVKWDSDPFRNINTEDDLRAAARALGGDAGRA